MLDWKRASFPTPGHPVVWGHNKLKPGRTTVLIYGHYDVQPPDPLDLWDSPPFEPVLKDGFVYARGSTDNKGQILSHILGVQEALEQNGDFPLTSISSSKARKRSAAGTSEIFCTNIATR